MTMPQGATISAIIENSHIAQFNASRKILAEPVHEISNNVPFDLCRLGRASAASV